MAEEIEIRSDAEQALIASSKQDIEQGDMVMPHLKLCQGTTKGVPEGVNPGDFFNALTGENYGKSVEFVVAGFRKGRFGMDEDDNIIAAGFEPLSQEGIPWEDHPLAEEQWKIRVQRGDIEWGSGPPISTTYNFFGFVADTEVPVRFSMMRTGAPAAKKWATMLRFLPAFWDVRFRITSKLVEKGKLKYHVPEIAQVGKTAPAERGMAVEIASALQQDRVKLDEDLESAAEGAAPKKTSGLAV